MIVPAKRLCDLCRNEIPSAAFVTLTYPMDGADIALLTPNRTTRGILNLMNTLAPVNAYQFEMCRGCVDGFMPMLSDLKTEFIRRMIAERELRALACERGDDR